MQVSSASDDTAGSAETLELPPGFDALTEHHQLVAALTDALSEIEDELTSSLANADRLAEDVARHLLDAGGKRVRPLLTVLASLVGNPQTADGNVTEISGNVRRVATVMELTHLATLYHDDVMDEAELRRGAPTAHRQWSNLVAILAGDLIFARASLGMSDMGDESIRAHAQTFEQLVMGQLQETMGPADGEDPLAHYLEVIRGKTASLISTAAGLGALHGGGDEHAIEIMKSYGEYAGMAFQLADDIIDLTADEATSGKTPGTDLRERVPTLPVLLMRQAADHGDVAATEAVALIDGELDTDEQLAAAVSAVKAHPVVDEAWSLTRGWSARAKQVLDGLDESLVKTALIQFADSVVNREG